MTLSSKIRETVVDELVKDFPARDWHLLVCDQYILIALVGAGVITRHDLMYIADKRLCAEGRQCYLQHIYSLRRGPVIFPDHTYNPGAFAYALAHHAFSKREESKIRFDHDDTIVSFIEQYRGECWHVVKSLITPPKVARLPIGDLGAMDTDSCEGCPV